MIDLRSDTVTQPTKAMKEAMFMAHVGDDVFEEDPSINQLEAKTAKLFGHQAALFCPSGTMTNQIAIRVHTQPGGEVICSNLAHIYHYEGGGIALNSGCSVRLIEGNRGRFTAQQVEENINNPNDVHAARTQLVALENTMNKGGGSVWDTAEIKEIKKVCVRNQLPLHLDGARLFNALIKTGESSSAIGPLFNSISICLSKGLGCPVGSLLVGNHDFIREARRTRKAMGGGMRQAGMLAAAGIYALDHHVERLREDHIHAEILADALKINGNVREVLPVETNIVLFKMDRDPTKVLEILKANGILAVQMGKDGIRLVTHLNINRKQVDQTAELLRSI